MCLGIYVPKEAKPLTKAEMEYAFHSNPHGAGFMYTVGNGPVVISKGFMTLEELWDAYKAIPKGADVGVHFRYATHGKIGPECCHPFPLRSSTNAMKNIHYTSHAGVLHNGIIHYAGPRTRTDADYSDTMGYIAHNLFPLRNVLDDELVQKMVELSICSSRLLIMRQGAKAIMIGHWLEDEGRYYSNGGYLGRRTYKYFSLDDCKRTKTVATKPAKKEEPKAYLPVKYNPLVGMSEDDIEQLYNMEHEDMGF